MAGGKGTRLMPMTKVINKHLLPVYDKPMIFYPLTTLLAAGIRDITLITNPLDIPAFTELLGDGSQYDCTLRYLAQETPGGIPEGIQIAKPLMQGDKVALILGDNLLIGKGLGRDLNNYCGVEGCAIFGSVVRNPSAYGVAELDSSGEILSLVEKPIDSISKVAIPGLYFFDEIVFHKVTALTPSKRGELEILDLLTMYKNEGKLALNMLERGSTWLDCGTPDQLMDASEIVRLLQERQGLNYGAPEEVVSAGKV
jgi:glucose-1-phosphate thymidylyltransferase